MTKIIAATIHVQTIEFVTGNGPMLNSVCAIPGTACVDTAGATATALCADGFATDGEAGCAFTLIANTMTKSAPTKKNLNPFTFRIHVR